jgi:hypothetical protein
MTGTDATPPGENTSEDVLEVTTEEDVRALAADVLDPERQYPIVCLTARPGQTRPALDPGRVRAIVGPHIPIYVIKGFSLAIQLAKHIPRRLGVHSGAARIWWPGVDHESIPSEHPRIHDPTDRYGEEAYKLLAAQFRTPERPELTIRQQLVLAERGRAKEEERRRAVERRLADLRRDRVERGRGDRHPHDEPAADTPKGCEQRKLYLAPVFERELGLDAEQRLHVLITIAWAQTQSSPADRRDHPLGRYVFGREFIESVKRKPVGVSSERVARVCAMVACRRATQTGAEPHPLRRTPSPTAPQWERADGATGWRCALKGSAGGPRLHYWQLSDGTIEFASVVTHDDFSIPGG